MKSRDAERDAQLREALAEVESGGIALPGITEPATRDTFVQQLHESIHRVAYVRVLLQRELSRQRTDPHDSIFDPIRAAIVHEREGNQDEACWLVFLFVHFGKHLRGGWRYIREVYGRLGKEPIWSWEEVSKDRAAFRDWLATNSDYIGRKTEPGGFGNHRKYESLDAFGPKGTGAAFASYVDWVLKAGGHQSLFDDALNASGGDPRKAFRALFETMRVTRFGRTAKFDYLAMIGKLRLADIEPDAAYFEGDKGPTAGARLLFGGNRKAQISRAELERLVQELDSRLHVGMQVIEDALCNWQKAPTKFKAFRG